MLGDSCPSSLAVKFGRMPADTWLLAARHQKLCAWRQNYHTQMLSFAGLWCIPAQCTCTRVRRFVAGPENKSRMGYVYAVRQVRPEHANVEAPPQERLRGLAWQVCPVESSWVGGFLQKLRGIDVQRLSGAAPPAAPAVAAAGTTEPAAGQQPAGAAAKDKKNDTAAVDAARARFAARKAARTQ